MRLLQLRFRVDNASIVEQNWISVNELEQRTANALFAGRDGLLSAQCGKNVDSEAPGKHPDFCI